MNTLVTFGPFHQPIARISNFRKRVKSIGAPLIRSLYALVGLSETVLARRVKHWVWPDEERYMFPFKEVCGLLCLPILRSALLIFCSCLGLTAYHEDCT